MSTIDRYRALCEQEDSIPFFSQSWWLDAVAGPENWNVVLVEKGGEIKAALPFYVERFYGLKRLTMPVLTQTLGPWIRTGGGSYTKSLGIEKDLMTELVAQLPQFDDYLQSWHHRRVNWLPFYWLGFHQTTRYTYILDDLSNKERLWEGMQSNIRGDIRKAENRFELKVDEIDSVEEFLELNEKVFSRQQLKLPYSRATVRRIDEACRERGCRKIFVARDANNRAHAGVYIVWDRDSAYYLMGGSDPKLRNSGATSLCMWHAIQHAASVTQAFDFEGSMMEPVERFFRAFGATQTPYFRVQKTPSVLLRVLGFLYSFKGK